MDIDITKTIEEAMKQMGRINILIAGKTGVGKSTLLNAVFGEDMAVTGVGKPVTQYLKEYSKQDSLYHLLDTKGFELDSYRQMEVDLLAEIDKRKTSDPKEHVHIMWYCISEEGARIEDAEIEFVNAIAKSIPVIVVLTKSFDVKQIFFSKVKDTFFGSSVSVVRVLSAPIETPIGTIKANGLDILSSATYEKIPEATQKAFAASQKVNAELRKKAVNKIIVTSAIAAGGIGATPIPFSDVALLAPTQITMIVLISRTMGLSFDTGFMSSLIASAAGVIGASYAGRAIVSNLLKLIPGAGSIIGGTVSAATASALTTTMGWAYYRTLESILNGNQTVTEFAIAEAFKQQLRNAK